VSSFKRRQTPRVKDGKVQRKNRTTLSPGFRNKPQDILTIERERPGPGYKHLLRKRDIGRFVGLLPEWEKLTRDLEAIVLVSGDSFLRGSHSTYAVYLCAWDRRIAVEWHKAYVQRHRSTLDRLHVPVQRVPGARYSLEFTESSARRFQLLGVLFELLGRRYDAAARDFGSGPLGGAGAGARYVRQNENRVWTAFREEFGA